MNLDIGLTLLLHNINPIQKSLKQLYRQIICMCLSIYLILICPKQVF